MRPWSIVLIALVCGVACGGDDGVSRDAGRDTGIDGGGDAAADAASDAGTDSGRDSGSDAGTDSGSDAGADAGSDAGADAGVDLSRGLVAHYRFDGNADDASGNGHHGSAMGTTPALDRFGTDDRAYAFDGMSSHVVVPDEPSLRLSSTVTLAAWVRRTRYEVDVILEKGGDWNTAEMGEANYGLGLHSMNSRMFYFFFAGGWRGTSGVVDQEWHHYVAIALDGASEPALYIDGARRQVQYTEGQATISLFESIRNLHIGAQLSPGFDYYGANVIDDVRIYDRVLSVAEIAALASDR
jgi:hypothetical protein